MVIEITSHSNPRFKYLKSLSKSRNRKKEGVFLMEGRPELDLALNKGLVPELIVLCESYANEDVILPLLKGQPPSLIKLPKALFDELAYQQVPGNFMALFAAWDTSLEALSGKGHLVVLESVEKPGNLGAILRSCDAFGVQELIVANTEIDLFNPNVLRNSRGAVFSVNCAFCSNEEAADFIERKELRMLAAALSDQACDYRSVAQDTPVALVLGAESKGLSPFWLNRASHIMIPMRGTVDSLNVSVSCAVMLSHLTATR